jgi:hypothetical protein
MQSRDVALLNATLCGDRVAMEHHIRAGANVAASHGLVLIAACRRVNRDSRFACAELLCRFGACDATTNGVAHNLAVEQGDIDLCRLLFRYPHRVSAMRYRSLRRALQLQNGNLLSLIFAALGSGLEPIRG